MVRRDLPAVTVSILAAGILLLLVYIGSRGLKDFDSALIGYAVASVFAFAAVVYRYTRWITHPTADSPSTWSPAPWMFCPAWPAGRRVGTMGDVCLDCGATDAPSRCGGCGRPLCLSCAAARLVPGSDLRLCARSSTVAASIAARQPRGRRRG